MHLISIVTVDELEARDHHFRLLLETGATEIDTWIIVCRGFDSGAHEAAQKTVAASHVIGDVNYVRVSPCGVSAARNAGIARLAKLDVTPSKSIVSFPDADCSYPAGFGGTLKQKFIDHSAELLVIPYGPSFETIDATRWPPNAVFKPSATQLLTLVSSAGIFVRGDVLVSLNGFDERLGVGTPREAAEDLEFVLLAFRNHVSVIFDSNLFVQHAYKKPVAARMIGNLSLLRSSLDIFPLHVYARAWARWFKIAPIGRDLFRSSGVKLVRLISTYERRPGIADRRNISGLLINTESPAELVVKAAEYASEGGTPSKTVLAAHISALNASSAKDFREAFNAADLSMVDGISLTLISVLTPGKRLQKLATTEFAPRVFEETSRLLGRKTRVALLGGEWEVVSAAAQQLKENHLVEVVFADHGFHDDFARPILSINEAAPDVLILGLGMPLEATWLASHKNALTVPLIITCGGWLRLLAGVESRAPEAMQKLHVEWLWRLVTDPKRTASRYTKGVLSVAAGVIRGWTR